MRKIPHRRTGEGLNEGRAVGRARVGEREGSGEEGRVQEESDFLDDGD